MSHVKIFSKLSQALKELDSLPAMPEIARKLLALPLETEAGEAQMLRLIAQDPQLTAKIIGLANSPALGVTHKINSVQDAAMLLGLQQLKSVAVGIATLSSLSKQPATKYFDPHELWSHSITVAIVMNTLAQAMPERLRPDEHQTFLAGLLHDIGIMALHHLDFSACDELHHQVRLQPKRSIYEIELELLGMTHDHIGAELARHWNLPVEIIAAVEQHHSAHSDNIAPANLLAKMVNIAERLLLDCVVAEHQKNAISESEWRELGIDPARAGELSALANEVAIQMAQLPEMSAKPYTTPAPSIQPLTHQYATENHLPIVTPLGRRLASWIGRILR